MILRPVGYADLKAIAGLDTAYTTTHVWQMEQRMAGEEIVTSFRTVRLPRPMKALTTEDLPSPTEAWRESDLFIVAEEGKDLLGYLRLKVEAGRKVGWINPVAVAPQHRRHGVASALVEEAKRWAQGRLNSLAAALPTKNYPAIKFFQRLGFTFCGFNDRYYPSGDIAVFFHLSLGEAAKG